jgi:FkbM family methyltransferase
MKLKVLLASIAYEGISRARRLAGKSDQAEVARRGIRWSLDLSEGIDFSIYLVGAFEWSTALTLDKLVKPGDIVFDIGANIGAHTLPMARKAGNDGRVFAFEPTAFAFQKLQKNLSLNPDLRARVEPCQTMLTDDPTAAVRDEIYSSWPLRAGEGNHPKHQGQLTATVGAVTDTLDSFVKQKQISRLDLIKIDVDGDEYPVLRGGIETLRRLRPTILLELAPWVHAEQGNSFPAMIDLLDELGYTLEKVGSNPKLPLSASELERMIPDGGSINAVARLAIR